MASAFQLSVHFDISSHLFSVKVTNDKDF
jgi:hypothetical protein